MPGLGTTATTLITTKGLFVLGAIPLGNTALTNGTVITPWFRLYIDENAPVPRQYIAAAGSRVYQPGEFADSLKYIDPTTGQPTSEPWMVVPRDQEAKYFNKGKAVTIKLVWGGKELEKTYIVSEHRANRLIEIVNVFNATKERIHVSVSGVKRIATRALIEVRNITLRRKPNK